MLIANYTVASVSLSMLVAIRACRVVQHHSCLTCSFNDSGSPDVREDCSREPVGYSACRLVLEPFHELQVLGYVRVCRALHGGDWHS